MEHFKVIRLLVKAEQTFIPTRKPVVAMHFSTAVLLQPGHAYMLGVRVKARRPCCDYAWSDFSTGPALNMLSVNVIYGERPAAPVLQALCGNGRQKTQTAHRMLPCAK